MQATVAIAMGGCRGRVMDWCAVDEGSAPPRIEIELIEHEGKRSRRDRKRGLQAAAPAVSAVPWSGSGTPDGGVFPPAVEPGPPGAGSDGPLRSERNRLVVTGLAVGAIALFIGWALGRSGGDGDGSAQTVDGATSTTVDDDTGDRATDASVVAGDTLPAAELPTTTRQRPTTTSTLPPVWQVSTVEIDPRLAGATDRIVAIGVDGDLIELDLATGEQRVLAPARRRSASTFAPIAGDDWIAISYDDGTPPLIFQGDSVEPRELAVGDPWAAFWQVDTDTLWTVSYDNTNGAIESVVELDLEGNATGREIETFGLWPSAADPAGGLIVGDSSIGMFTVDGSGSQRLPDGRPIAYSAAHILLYVCGDTIDDCGLSVFDRATGASRGVPWDGDPAGEVNRFSGWWGPAPAGSMITADGSAALLPGSDQFGRASVMIVDLLTGEVREFGAAQTESFYTYPSGVWSADGRFAYVVDQSTVTAFDRATGDAFLVVLGAFPEVRSLTVRPPLAG